MKCTRFADGTMIYTAWCQRRNGLVFECQVRATDQDDATRRIESRWPDVIRVIADPDLADPDIDPVT